MAPLILHYYNYYNLNNEGRISVSCYRNRVVTVCIKNYQLRFMFYGVLYNNLETDIVVISLFGLN